MGKKSRKQNGIQPPPTSIQQNTMAVALNANTSPQQSVVVNSAITTTAPIFYPSDGPSDVELLQTKSASLQAKLDLLTDLGMENNRAGFVKEFVPLDLSEMDVNLYLQDLTTELEAEGHWTNLISEIAAIRCGKKVDRIEGDQITKAIFHFEHPLLHKCDREVAFCCHGGEWRAEG